MRYCTQVIHVADDFRFLWVPLSSDSGVGDVKILHEMQHQEWVAHDVAVVHVPLVCLTSIFLQRMLRVVGTSGQIRAIRLKVG